MKKYRFSMAMSLNGCHTEEVVELDDDLTEEEVQEMHLDWIHEQIDGGWEEV